MPEREGPPLPAELDAALGRDPQAAAIFAQLRREYRNAKVKWVAGAVSAAQRTVRSRDVLSDLHAYDAARRREGLPAGSP